VGTAEVWNPESDPKVMTSFFQRFRELHSQLMMARATSDLSSKTRVITAHDSKSASCNDRPTSSWSYWACTRRKSMVGVEWEGTTLLDHVKTGGMYLRTNQFGDQCRLSSIRPGLEQGSWAGGKLLQAGQKTLSSRRLPEWHVGCGRSKENSGQI